MILAHLETLDRALVAKGWPALSFFWKETLARFLASSCRQLVLRVGRRGGKSSSLCRLAVAVALYGEHAIPPGDVGVVAFISISRDEASQRLRTIKAILDAIGVKHRPVDGGIELVGRPVVFKVFAASVAGVSGFTSILVLCDEVAKWRDTDTGSNPAKEVLASLRPTMATQRTARIVLSSSPMGNEDAHAKAFDAGDDVFQMTGFAPTWIANPTVTEAETHDLEKDDRVHAREYAARAQGGSLSAFDPDAVELAFNPELLHILAQPALVIDAAARGGDGFAFGSVAWMRASVDDTERYEVDEERSDRALALMSFKRDFNGNKMPRKDWEPPSQKLAFRDLTVIDASFRSREGIVTADDIARQIADLGHRIGARRAYSDNFEAFGFESLLARHQIKLEAYSWGGQAKPKAIARLRRMLAEGAVSFERNETLRRQLLAFEEVVTPNGIRFAGKDPTGAHFDLVSAVLTGIMAEQQGALTGSLIGRMNTGFAQYGAGDFGNA